MNDSDQIHRCCVTMMLPMLDILHPLDMCVNAQVGRCVNEKQIKCSTGFAPLCRSIFRSAQ